MENANETLSETNGVIPAPRVDGRRRRRKFTDEIWALVDVDYFGGMTALEVSAKYGMAVQTVHTHYAGRGKRARAKAASAFAQGLRRDKPAQSGHRPMSEEEARSLVRAVFAESFQGAADTLRAAPLLVVTEVRADRKIRTRVTHPPETWALVRIDYEEGGFTVPVIAKQYGIKDATIKRRAARGGWSKTRRTDVAPLTKPADPAQVDGAGQSVWAEIAHAAQLPPEGKWRTWLFQGGRGAGKTRAGAEWLAARAEATPHGRFALIAATEHDAREVMIEGPSGLRSLPGREWPRYEASRRLLRWRNGAVGYVFSAQEPERLRGPEYMAAWADEFCAWPRHEHTLAMIRLGLRLGAAPQLVVTTTPKPLAALRRLREAASCVVTEAGTAVNAANLSESFVEDLQLLYGGTRIEKQEIEGVLLDAEGALWRLGDISRCEVPARFERVVVGVDPPAGAGVCGIVVAGRVGDRAYVLEDASCGNVQPLDWARRVAAMVAKWGAVKVVAESNQGGNMVRSTLRQGDVACPIELVHAGAAKAVRAQPASALYQKGRVMHCGVFAMLEEEMLAMGSDKSGGCGEGKCDRADALVWALDDLLVRPRARPGVSWL
ncbi:MAG TPA: terminase family protein [Hyphomonadaceae bacterium]|nr:terminase family protein [Hyphomonadaceae bacterium]